MKTSRKIFALNVLCRPQKKRLPARANVLSEAAMTGIYTTKYLINLSSASNHRCSTLGVISLTVTGAEHSCCTLFVVEKSLGADAILGCQDIDQQVENIAIRRRICVLVNGDAVPIVRRRIQPLREECSTELPVIGLSERVPTDFVKTAERKVIEYG